MEQTTPLTVENIAEAFRDADKAALAASNPSEDGGTCNRDTPAVRFPRLSDKKIQEAARLAGIRVTDFQWFGGRRYYWINVSMQGQGNNRSRMAEAACKTLAAHGLHAVMYYQMD